MVCVCKVCVCVCLCDACVICVMCVQSVIRVWCVYVCSVCGVWVWLWHRCCGTQVGPVFRLDVPLNELGSFTSRVFWIRWLLGTDCLERKQELVNTALQTSHLEIYLHKKRGAPWYLHAGVCFFFKPPQGCICPEHTLSFLVAISESMKNKNKSKCACVLWVDFWGREDWRDGNISSFYP